MGAINKAKVLMIKLHVSRVIINETELSETCEKINTALCWLTCLTFVDSPCFILGQLMIKLKKLFGTSAESSLTTHLTIFFC